MTRRSLTSYTFVAMKSYCLCAAALIVTSSLFAQQKKTNLADTIVNAKLVQLSYQFQVPFADLADRFGTNNSFGAGLIFKMKKNYLIGGEINLITGGNIKEDTIIDGLLTSQGFLIGVNGLAESAVL